GPCTSCMARQMTDTAAYITDAIWPTFCPAAKVRQWVVTSPPALRALFSRDSEVLARCLSIVYHTIATHQIKKAGLTQRQAQTGAITAIQHSGSKLNLNPHLHMLFPDA